MDNFLNSLNENKFRSTNSLWNQLCLNDPWSVGYVTFLIEQQDFNEKEEWENFYYDTGKIRAKKLEECPKDIAIILNNCLLKHSSPSTINPLSDEIKKLNYQYGRTKEELAQKGEILFKHMKINPYKISLNECIECVRFRTICETWNGVILRERNTVQRLKEFLPAISFKKVESSQDHKYAIDYELFHNGSLLCAVQIKPKSYLSHSSFLNTAKSANHKKNAMYKEVSGKDVYYIISDTKGIIFDTKPIEEIKELIQ